MNRTLSEMIATAIEPKRAAYVAAAVEAAEYRVSQIREKVEAEGEKAYPRPSSNLSHRDYMPILNLHNFVWSLCTKQSAYSFKKDSTKPDFYMDDAKVARYLDTVRVDANASFDAYAEKIASKVFAEGVDYSSVKLLASSRSLWNESTLEFTAVDGTVTYWKTQIILNCSVLGKLFNQWPTRKIKGGAK